MSERLDEKQRREILFNLYLFSFPFKTQFSFSRLKFNHKIRKDHCTIKTTCKIWDTPTTLSRSYLTPLLVRYKTHPFLFWKTSEKIRNHICQSDWEPSVFKFITSKRDVIQYRPKRRFKYSTTMHKNNFKERMQFSLGFN